MDIESIQEQIDVKLYHNIEVFKSSMRRRAQLETGLRTTADTGGIFVKVKRTGDVTLLHDYLKSLVLRGRFSDAMRCIRQYIGYRHRGVL